MNIFEKGTRWEAQEREDLTRMGRIGWRLAGVEAVMIAILAVALATLAPFVRRIPYIVKVDALGNTEILQPFDNRMVGTQEMMDKHWARKYVQAREQFNWWLVGGDYDLINRLTDPTILGEYNTQFEGPNGMDKVFGPTTERRVNIISVAPSPTMRNQMVVRLERTTISKGVVVEQAVPFVVNLAFKYTPKTFAPEADLQLNPIGYTVYAYRRDAESTRSMPAAAGSAPSATGGGA